MVTRAGTWWCSVAEQDEQRHGLADFLEGELPKLRAEWEGGSYRALIRAFGWCAGNGYKFPGWLKAAVMDELQYSMANRPRGGPSRGTRQRGSGQRVGIAYVSCWSSSS